MTKKQYEENIRYSAIENVQIEFMVFWRMLEENGYDSACLLVLQKVDAKIDLLQSMKIFTKSFVEYLKDLSKKCRCLISEDGCEYFLKKECLGLYNKHLYFMAVSMAESNTGRTEDLLIQV